jgi:hypothetical protein
MPVDPEPLPPSGGSRASGRASAQAPLVIAAVTALLRDVLANGLIRIAGATQLGDVNVTVLPPDRVTLGSEEPNQLNLFMYRLEPQVALPPMAKRGGEGRRRDIGLKLHYLVTAYSAQEYHTELLLGCAVHLLGALPLLTVDAAKTALRAKGSRSSRGPRSPLRETLGASDVLETADRISLMQQFLTLEDTSKLWSMLQSRYRPSVTYEVSAVRMSVDG